MYRMRYAYEVSVKKGVVSISEPLGIEKPEQLKIAGLTKSALRHWVKEKVKQNPTLVDSSLIVRSKYTETSHGIALEFKIANG